MFAARILSTAAIATKIAYTAVKAAPACSRLIGQAKPLQFAHHHTRCFAAATTASKTCKPKTFLYDILAIREHATKTEIKKAYIEMCKKYHPDVNDGKQIKFMEIRQAYEFLTNEQKKKTYNELGSTDYQEFMNKWKKEFDVTKKKHIDYGISDELSIYVNEKAKEKSTAKRKYENLYLIQDASYSMKEDVSGNNITKCVNAMKKMIDVIHKYETIKTVSLKGFAGNNVQVCDNTNIENAIDKLSMGADHIFRGINHYSTSLYDALRSSIEHTYEINDLNKTLFIAMTDGQDNSSDMCLSNLTRLIKLQYNIHIILVALEMSNITELQKIADAAQFGKVMRIGDKFEYASVADVYDEITNQLLLGSTSNPLFGNPKETIHL